MIAKKTLILMLAMITGLSARCQKFFANPSFEGPTMYALTPPQWQTDLVVCGGRSTPDTQPGYWDCYLPPFEGNSYLGMVARIDQTSEGIYQRSLTPFKPGWCYSFEIQLAKAPYYEDHAQPITLEVWLGNNGCERIEKVWTSPLVAHLDWRPYTVTFSTKSQYEYIILMATGYRGNILLDAIAKETAIELIPPASLIEAEVVCVGETIVLDATIASSASYQWSNGETSPAINVSNAGMYAVTISQHGCSATFKTMITQDSPPTVALPRDTVVYFGADAVIIDAKHTGTNTDLLWSTGTAGSTIRIDQGGEYWITAMNDCGTDSDTINVSMPRVFIPNIVTDNNDGFNDSFVIQGLEPGAFTLKIFNRYGTLVFSTDQYNNDWPINVSAGIYYYAIDMKRIPASFKDVLHVVSD